MGRRVLALVLPALIVGCASAPARTADCPVTTPPMVDLGTLQPAPAMEIRYATPRNFTGEPLPGYEEPRALLRPEDAEALRRVEAALRRDGLGLKVFDAYRPERASRAMVEWARRSGNQWVIEQGYVAPESGHNRGATIDLTLIRLRDGAEVDMGTPYDTFSEDAHTDRATGEILANRTRLIEAMAAEGWENYPLEWWHFSRPSRASPMDIPLGCFP